MITTVSLVIIHHLTWLQICLTLVMGAFKIYSVRNFQIYDIALITIVTMFYIISPELILLLYLFIYLYFIFK